VEAEGGESEDAQVRCLPVGGGPANGGPQEPAAALAWRGVAYGIHCSPCLSSLENLTMKSVWPRDDDGFIAVGRTCSGGGRGHTTVREAAYHRDHRRTTGSSVHRGGTHGAVALANRTERLGRLVVLACLPDRAAAAACVCGATEATDDAMEAAE